MLTEIFNNLHFLRPQWFLAFIGLALYLLIMIKKHGNQTNWQKVCDKQLRPYVLTSKQGKYSFIPVFLTFIAVSLCITALAGPVYKKLPQPVFREQSALVILLDLSQSMNATDIKPSRLERAKLELLDILKQRHGGQTALIVYAADAFTVTPLTDDNRNIANLVPVLDTSMMPAQGSNLAPALAKAQALFVQAGITRGNVLVITDGIHQRDRQAIKHLFAQGYRVSIFGIGTPAGSPIPLSDGFLQDAKGAIVIPKLNIPSLQKMALAGGGLYTGITADDSDTQKLSQLFSARTNNVIHNNKTKKTDLRADSWREDGVWLVLPLLFFAALWARKGWLALLLIFTLPVPQPSYAANTQARPAHTTASSHSPGTHALSTDNLWLTPDQKAMRAFNHGDTKTAAKKFNNPAWKASALYRNGNYAAAARLFAQTASNATQHKKRMTSSDDFYNQGNALARMGNYKAALAAYKKAIALNKNNKDAIYNRKLVKKAIKKQQAKQQRKQNKKQQNRKNKSAKNKTGKNKNKQTGSRQQKNKANKNGKNKDKNTQNKKQQQATDKNKKNKNSSAQQRQRQKNSQQENKSKQNKKNKTAQNKSADKKQSADKSKHNKQQQKEAFNPQENTKSEDKKATEQWLRRIPDDPGGLLRRKFLYQYSQLPDQHNSKQPW